MTLESVAPKIPWFSIAVAVIALCAPFFFPWQAVVALSIVAALFVPPIAFVAGVLLDALHWGGSGVPLFSILGLIIAIVGHFVHQFFKTRIMV